ncbi:unnamed protein product [Closterium sp. NIES-65]|nr:unnamed protein product [Closterium sp. NIES-65]
MPLSSQRSTVEAADVADVRERLQAKLGQAGLLGASWRGLRSDDEQRKEEVRSEGVKELGCLILLSFVAPSPSPTHLLPHSSSLFLPTLPPVPPHSTLPPFPPLPNLLPFCPHLGPFPPHPSLFPLPQLSDWLITGPGSPLNPRDYQLTPTCAAQCNAVETVRDMFLSFPEELRAKKVGGI